MLGETSQGRRAYLADAREKYLANDGRIAARTPLNAACRTQRPPPTLNRLCARLSSPGRRQISAKAYYHLCSTLCLYGVKK